MTRSFEELCPDVEVTPAPPSFQGMPGARELTQGFRRSWRALASRGSDRYTTRHSRISVASNLPSLAGRALLTRRERWTRSTRRGLFGSRPESGSAWIDCGSGSTTRRSSRPSVPIDSVTSSGTSASPSWSDRPLDLLGSAPEPPRGDFRPHFVGAGRDHDDHLGGFRGKPGLHDVPQHGPSADGMQHLGGGGLQSFALARGEHHQGQGARGPFRGLGQPSSSRVVGSRAIGAGSPSSHIEGDGDGYQRCLGRSMSVPSMSIVHRWRPLPHDFRESARSVSSPLGSS